MEKVSGPSPIIKKEIPKKEAPLKEAKTSEVKTPNKQAAEVTLSDKAKELKKELSGVEKALKIQQKKFGNVEKPAIIFISGFDWFGASSVKGNYDGIIDMSEAVDGADHYAWDEKEKIIAKIKERKTDQPIALVGHSFGGDTAVEIANELNTMENGFRKIDLLITLDSVGMDNDLIPQNVSRNLNFVAQGPYEILNDGPNIAANYKKTDVDNYLRYERHADLDDATDIQIDILNEINKVIS